MAEGYYGRCRTCDCVIYEHEPALEFKQNIICHQCYIDLIPEIYRMAYIGDGGIIHIVFKECLSSNYNRKHRTSLSSNKKLLSNLLHKYNFMCVLCGSKKNLTIDHKIPVAKGGTDQYSNLQILCRSCNSHKGVKIE